MANLAFSVAPRHLFVTSPPAAVAAPPRFAGRRQLARPSGAGGTKSHSQRIPPLVVLDAVAWFVARFVTIVLLGVPLQFIVKHPKSMDAPWIWSFWFRLPIVAGVGYAIFPWWCATIGRLFQPTAELALIVSTVFAPVVALLYAALAGYAVVSLWGRLEKIRSSLHREFALLELLETRLPKEDKALQKLFADHVQGIEQYEVRRGVPAPARLNHLAEMASSPVLSDLAAQQEIRAIAEVRAERRAAEDICFPTVVWASLRFLATLLFVAFVLPCGAKPIAEGRGMRILFSIFVVILFWVNHLCRDLVDLCGGDFQLDVDELRRDAGLFRKRREKA